MKLPKIQITRWADPNEVGSTLAYSIPDSQIMHKYLMFDLIKTMNNKVASYMARRFIVENRKTIDTWLKHGMVKRYVEREVKKTFSALIK